MKIQSSISINLVTRVVDLPFSTMFSIKDNDSTIYIKIDPTNIFILKDATLKQGEKVAIPQHTEVGKIYGMISLEN